MTVWWEVRLQRIEEQSEQEVNRACGDTLWKEPDWEGRRGSIQRGIFNREETDTYLGTKQRISGERKNKNTEWCGNNVWRDSLGKEEDVI